MRLFLIRHPPPAVAPGTCYGISDPDLAGDVGRWADGLRPLLPAAVPLFSSPLRRCRRLAEALDPAARADPRLREMNFGSWELKPWHEIPRAQIDAWAAAPLHYAPPHGESVQAVRARALDFLKERLSEGSAECAAVTHAGIIRILTGHLRRLPQSEWLALRVGHGELTVLDAPDDPPAPPPGS